MCVFDGLLLVSRKCSDVCGTWVKWGERSPCGVKRVYVWCDVCALHDAMVVYVVWWCGVVLRTEHTWLCY